MIYIAGKITGLPLEEVDAKFQKVENELHAFGLKVINPRKLGIPVTWPWERQMEVCLKVIEERATAIFMLEDWMKSKGAKDVFYRVGELNLRRKANLIAIYFEDKSGMIEIGNDVMYGVITCKIPERL